MAHRCSYCGKAGHKRPTCPTRAAAIREVKGVYETSVPTKTKKIEEIQEVEMTGKKKTLSAWAVAEKVIPHSDRILLYGPPGTGKTTVANRTAKGQVFNITLTEEMPAAELRGHFVPKGGEFVWMDGPAMQAYRNGGRLVLNEIDRGSADALIFCYALLDDRGISRISLPTGEHVEPHQDFTVVATMNGEPQDLPEALQDRFQVRLLIDKPHPDAMKSLPDDLRKAAQNSVSGTGESRVSFRSWKAFADLREKLDEDTAAKAVFGNRASSILDTLKLSRMSTVTADIPEYEDEDYSDERRGVAGFLPGDKVIVSGYGTYSGMEFVVAAECKSIKDRGESDYTLEAFFMKHGAILVGDGGSRCFPPETLELVL